MALFETLVVGTLLLTSSVETAALGGTYVSRYDLVCDTSAQEPLCSAFRAALDESGYDARIVSSRSRSSDIAFRFQVERRTANVLSGRLVWDGAHGQRGAGPVLELAASDQPIREDMLRIFARQVVTLTPMPN